MLFFISLGQSFPFMLPKSFFGMVEVNENAPALWGCKEGDGERPLLHQHKELCQHDFVAKATHVSIDQISSRILCRILITSL